MRAPRSNQLGHFNAYFLECIFLFRPPIIVVCESIKSYSFLTFFYYFSPSSCPKRITFLKHLKKRKKKWEYIIYIEWRWDRLRKDRQKLQEESLFGVLTKFNFLTNLRLIATCPSGQENLRIIPCQGLCLPKNHLALSAFI